MSTSKKLILALLSMDSYNRGYAPGVVPSRATLGSIKILTDSSDEKYGMDAASKAAGFYAVAYAVSDTGTDLDGKTVEAVSESRAARAAVRAAPRGFR